MYVCLCVCMCGWWLGWGVRRGDKRVHEDMVGEWMRAENEAGPRCSARGEQRRSADRLET